MTPGGTETVTVNQRIEGGRWHLLKTVTLAANDNFAVELSDQAPGEVVADAVAITPPLSLADHFDWSPALPSVGDYAVFAKWQAAPDRATDATYEITHSTGVDLVKVDQRVNGGEWRYLGTWSFDPSQSPKVSLLASLTGTVDADAVRFVTGDAIGGAVAYSHSDQIATIQKLTDASGTLVWDRIARPFGETVSISAASGIEQRLRFPGQYADETGLSYNYFRDYDPTLGRYAQSDPTGLKGGINTYAYVGGNPLRYSDPEGLGWKDNVRAICAAFDIFFAACGISDPNHVDPDPNANPPIEEPAKPRDRGSEGSDGDGKNKPKKPRVTLPPPGTPRPPIGPPILLPGVQQLMMCVIDPSLPACQQASAKEPEEEGSANACESGGSRRRTPAI